MDSLVLKEMVINVIKKNPEVFPSPQSISKFLDISDSQTVARIRDMLSIDEWLTHQNKWITLMKYGDGKKTKSDIYKTNSYNYDKYLASLKDKNDNVFDDVHNNVSTNNNFRTLLGILIVNYEMSNINNDGGLNVLAKIEALADLDLPNVMEYFNNHLYRKYSNHGVFHDSVPWVLKEDIIAIYKSPIINEKTKDLILNVFSKQLSTYVTLEEYIDMLGNKHTPLGIIKYIIPYFDVIVANHFEALFKQDDTLGYKRNLSLEINELLNDVGFNLAFEKRNKILTKQSDNLRESLYQSVARIMSEHLPINSLLDLTIDEQLAEPLRNLCIGHLIKMLDDKTKLNYQKRSLPILVNILNNSLYPTPSRIFAGRKIIDLITSYREFGLLNKYIFVPNFELDEVRKYAIKRSYDAAVNYIGRQFSHEHLQKSEINIILGILSTRWMPFDDKKHIVDWLAEKKKYSVLSTARYDVNITSDLKEYILEKIDAIQREIKNLELHQKITPYRKRNGDKSAIHRGPDYDNMLKEVDEITFKFKKDMLANSYDIPVPISGDFVKFMEESRTTIYKYNISKKIKSEVSKLQVLWIKNTKEKRFIDILAGRHLLVKEGLVRDAIVERLRLIINMKIGLDTIVNPDNLCNRIGISSYLLSAYLGNINHLVEQINEDIKNLAKEANLPAKLVKKSSNHKKMERHLK